ncbi:hypothetical protein [Nevskia sp.]|uniref:hypothetical protein n=1 Tax=Nevskia sp. TaxID=1929292 RepID=UPI0025D4983A|nr:hypothetical protein [Nevskia sp.]
MLRRTRLKSAGSASFVENNIDLIQLLEAILQSSIEDPGKVSEMAGTAQPSPPGNPDGGGRSSTQENQQKAVQKRGSSS